MYAFHMRKKGAVFRRGRWRENGRGDAMGCFRFEGVGEFSQLVLQMQASCFVHMLDITGGWKDLVRPAA